MSCEVKLNLFASISIILAIISLLMFISFDKKIGGNILNTNSYKTESTYYIADINGNQKEISEDIWNKSYKLTIITFVFVSIAGIFVVYLFVRYIFIPTLKNNFQIIKNYISKHKKKLIMYVISKNYPYSESLEMMAKKEALEAGLYPNFAEFKRLLS